MPFSLVFLLYVFGKEERAFSGEVTAWHGGIKACMFEIEFVLNIMQ